MEVGKVKCDTRWSTAASGSRVDFDVDRSLPLYQSTTAQIRYANLIGDRYLELKRGEGEGADRSCRREASSRCRAPRRPWISTR